MFLDLLCICKPMLLIRRAYEHKIKKKNETQKCTSVVVLTPQLLLHHYRLQSCCLRGKVWYQILWIDQKPFMIYVLYIIAAFHCVGYLNLPKRPSFSAHKISNLFTCWHALICSIYDHSWVVKHHSFIYSFRWFRGCLDNCPWLG